MIISSISAKHFNNQLQSACIESWVKHDKFVFIQSKNEIETLKSAYPGYKFIATNNTTKNILKKELVCISAFIDYAKSKKENLLIINSDIYLSADKYEFKEDGITVFQRIDYNEHFSDGSIFQNGFDAFYIPHKFLKMFPSTIYSMGACWWDYWLPFEAIKRNVPLYGNNNSAYHKRHPLQWQQSEWNLYADIFKRENNIFITNLGQMGNFVLAQIKSKLIYEN